mgnify:CR=1 FL=1
MKTPAMFTKACVLAALVFTNTASAYAFNFNYADPDFIASRRATKSAFTRRRFPTITGGASAR